MMMSNWIERVSDSDQILHLGDVVMGPRGAQERWIKIVSVLPGQKFLILGNHDKLPISAFERAGFTIVPEFVHQQIAFTHRPCLEDRYDDDGNDWKVNLHGHTHTNEWKPDHDGIPLGERTYINICVEHTDYYPVRLGNVYPIKQTAS